jgi:hypothetical protein
MAIEVKDTSTGTGSRPSVYDGFMSYSHAADGLLAPRLQSGLQRFAQPWWKRRALRIFRDESSLSANPHLWSSITEALDESEWFVLLLSPDAASSPWVNQEIDYWKTERDPSRILPVVTGGEFGWSDGDVLGSAVPDALRGVFAEEPRWVDLRFVESEGQLDLKNPRFSSAVADVASAIRGVPKDELESEEVRQHRRTRRTAWSAGITLVVLLIATAVTAVFAVSQMNEAEEQRNDAQQQRNEAEEQRSIAEDAARSEADQRALAEQAQEAAVEEAVRANEEAKKLLDFFLQRDNSDAHVPSRNVPPADAPTIPIPIVDSAPDTPRLNFLSVSCNVWGRVGGSSMGDTNCFRDAEMVHPDGLQTTRIWLADEPFHIRHGFINPNPEPLQLDGPAFAGYDVRVYVTRRNGPELDGGAFPIEETFRYHTDSLVRETNDWCGPTLNPSDELRQCDLFVTDFPDGLPPGRYDIWVEWIAPCQEWVTDELCIETGASQSLALFTAQVSMPFYSDEYRPQDDGEIEQGGGLPSWPLNPWTP